MKHHFLSFEVWIPCFTTGSWLERTASSPVSLLLNTWLMRAYYFPPCRGTLLILKKKKKQVTAKADLERYLNTVTSEWVTLMATLEAMKQSSFSCMVVTVGAQGKIACQPQSLQDKWEDPSMRHNVRIVEVPECSESWSAASVYALLESIPPGWGPTTGQVSHSTAASNQAGSLTVGLQPSVVLTPFSASRGRNNASKWTRWLFILCTLQVCTGCRSHLTVSSKRSKGEEGDVMKGPIHNMFVQILKQWIP